jgi:carbon storage regulator
MLVLSRKRGETLFIGNDISITVIEIKGNRTKIAIKAPDQLSVFRAERCESTGASSSGDACNAPALFASSAS